jgi:hypothetical protein
MTTRKYNTPEERREAQREQRRLRAAIIQQLLEQHQMEMQAKATENAAKARLAQPQPRPAPPAPETAGLEAWRRMLRHKLTRSIIIRTLLDEHYDELKAELDAYRLIKASE